MSFITGKHVPRRTMLRGLGATVALPFLDAMVPARGLWSRTAAAASLDRHAAGVHRDGARRRPAAADVGRDAASLVAGRGRARRSTSAPSVAQPARALPQAPDHRQRHRRAQRRGGHAAGDRRRSLPLERRVPHPGASEADRELGRARRHLARSDLRAALRPGHADPVDAAVHRERRPGRRLRLRLLVRLHRHDQLGVADRAAADDPRPADGVRSAVRRRRLDEGARGAAPGDGAASSTTSPAQVADLNRTARPERPAADGALPRRRARDRAAHPEGRSAQRERRGARAARRARPACPIRSTSTSS